MSSKKALLFAILVLSMLVFGCASSPLKKEELEKELNEKNDQISELKNQVGTLTGRLESLETKLSSMNDKVDKTQNSLETLTSTQKHRTTPTKQDDSSTEKINSTGVAQHPSEGAGVPVEPMLDESDPESGFVSDSIVSDYRQAKILFDAQKYPEAILAFSAFVQHNTDHVLAGSAQFYVGESYFRQKEYRLALREFQRVLTSYDRSSHLPEALKQIAATETILQNGNDAAKHQQQLLSLFPNSPAVAKLNSEPTTTESHVDKPAPEITAAPAPVKPALDEPPVSTPPPSTSLPTAPMPKEEPKGEPKMEQGKAQ
jgi:TolA-binding protein